MKIYILDMVDEEIPEDIKNYWMTYVQEEKKRRLQNYKFNGDFNRTLAADVLSRYLISRELHNSMDSIEFSYNQYGKPYIKNFKDIYFNISHSRRYVICAISRKNIGIDIENVDEYDLGVAKQVCNYDELVALASTDNKREYFNKLWVLKESYIKATGQGFYMDARLVNFIIDEDKIQTNIQNARFDILQYNEYWIGLCELL